MMIELTTQTKKYSYLFSNIYDQQKPVRKELIGNGVHYSIFRCVESKNVIGEDVNDSEIHDFSIIWDETHDERVIPIIEYLYVKGIFSPVQFIGIRNNILYIVVAAKFYFHIENLIECYINKIESACNAIGFTYGFSLTPSIGYFDRSGGMNPTLGHHQCEPGGIINAHKDSVILYLKHIDLIWFLGTISYFQNLQKEHELYFKYPVLKEIGVTPPLAPK